MRRFSTALRKGPTCLHGVMYIELIYGLAGLRTAALNFVLFCSVPPAKVQYKQVQRQQADYQLTDDSQVPKAEHAHNAFCLTNMIAGTRPTTEVHCH